MVTKLRDLNFSKWLKVWLASIFCRALVRISSFVCVKSSNQCSKAALSDSREVKKSVSSFLEMVFFRTFFTILKLFLISTVLSFLSIASRMHSWFISNSFFFKHGSS